MTEKAYSVFLCVLLISVLFFSLTTAGRVLLDTLQKEDGSGNHANGGIKMGVQPRKSNPALPATGQSSPAHATPFRKPANNAAAGDESGDHLYAGNKRQIKPSDSNSAPNAGH